MITVQPVEPSQVKRGDIILYRNLKGLIAHRVVAVEKKGDESQGRRFSNLYFLRSLFTQSSSLISQSLFSPQSPSLNPHHLFFLRGDGEGKDDEPVEPRQILGKVVLIEGNRGAINPNLWKTKIGNITLLLFYRLKRWTLRNIIRKTWLLFGDQSTKLK